MLYTTSINSYIFIYFIDYRLGLKSLNNGIIKAFKSLIIEPKRALSNGNAFSIIPGLYYGVFDFLFYPLYGIVNFLKEITIGTKLFLVKNNELLYKRYKRYIDNSKIIFKYNKSESYGYDLFQSIIKENYYLYSCEIKGSRMIFITDKTLYIINKIKHKILWKYEIILLADEINEKRNEMRLLYKVYFNL